MAITGRVGNNRISLGNGVTLVASGMDQADFSSKVHLAIGDQVEHQFPRKRGTHCLVLARVDGSVCGSPWARPIIIPLFRDLVYRNRIEPVLEVVVESPTRVTSDPNRSQSVDMD